jgi:hypothetical protein
LRQRKPLLGSFYWTGFLPNKDEETKVVGRHKKKSITFTLIEVRDGEDSKRE